MTKKHVSWDRLCLIPAANDKETAAFDMDHESSSADDTPDEEQPPVETVLQTLDDDTCRQILTALDEPKAATALCEECDVPSSTMYRKLDLLREAALVEEYTEVRRDGPNATLYERNFTTIAVGIDDADEFTVQVKRPAEQPEDRMATFWTEMKRES
ncbi:winged helix-turn-helix domain-containing protein [Natrialba sp. SSL1]|uniref:winged helix-turn-helix domain-containing protein n=1 Tax=Natrialba sp. SSL1 TaxID=1869245 RepID=UPI0008F866A3|nr:helix-turn-helix domain-containing protein [Natrialba sp. SSL1]OIB58021.1 transcriptional regulator [Natrialba sp. SSL1]